MGKVYQFCAGDDGIRTTANTTQFWQLFGMLTKNNTEANCEMIMRTAGTLSNLHVHVGTNNVNAAVGVKVRKNGADTSLAVVVTAATTGHFTDDVNTVTVAAGDKLCLTTVPGGGSTGTLGMAFVSTVFSATTDTATRLTVSPEPTAAAAGRNHSNASTSYFYTLNGVMSGNIFAEANVKCRQRHTGTFRNLAVKVRTNTRTTATTIKLRKNGADTTSTISVGATTTGWLEDTTHTDAIAVGDDFNYQVATGTGSGSFVIDYIAVDYVSPDGYGQLIVNSFNNPDSIGKSSTKDIQMSGDNLWVGLAVAQVQNRIVPDAELTFSDLTILVRNNNLDSTSTLRFRKNNADGNQSVSIAANSAGLFSDISNTDTTAVEDLINYRVVTGTGGTFDVLDIDAISCWSLDAVLAPPTAIKAECDLVGIDEAGEFAVDFTTADHVQRQTLWFSLSS